MLLLVVKYSLRLV